MGVMTDEEIDHLAERLASATDPRNLMAGLVIEGKATVNDIRAAVNRAEEINERPRRYKPLSVRHGGLRKRLAWRLKGFRQALAFRLAPWLTPPSFTTQKGVRFSECWERAPQSREALKEQFERPFTR